MTREHPRSVWRRGWARMRRVPREAYVWTAGLVAMATMDPTSAHLISLCPFDALGINFCPGCGLGHAVAYLARGELAASFHAHPLGGPAVLVLLHHIVRLARPTVSSPESTPPTIHAFQTHV